MRIPILTRRKEAKERKLDEARDKRRIELVEIMKLEASHQSLVTLVALIVQRSSPETQADLCSEKPVERIIPPGVRAMTTEPTLEIKPDRVYIRDTSNAVRSLNFVRNSSGDITNLRVVE